MVGAVKAGLQRRGAASAGFPDSSDREDAGPVQLIGRRSRTALDLDWGDHWPCWSVRLGIARTVIAARRRPAGLLGNGAHQSRRNPWRLRRWSDDRGSVLRPASRGAGRYRAVAGRSVDAGGCRRLLLADQLVERRFGSQGAGGAMGIIVGSVVDGVPESAILGIQVGIGTTISLSFVAAVFISNVP
jgi:hypothetical protein